MQKKSNTLVEKIKNNKLRKSVVAVLMAGVMTITGCSNKQVNQEHNHGNDKIDDILEEVLPKIPSIDEFMEMLKKENTEETTIDNNNVLNNKEVDNKNINIVYNKDNNKGSHNKPSTGMENNKPGVNNPTKPSKPDQPDNNDKPDDNEISFDVKYACLVNAVNIYAKEVGVNKDTTIYDILKYIELNYGKQTVSIEEVQGDQFLLDSINEYILKKIVPIKPDKPVVNPLEYITNIIKDYNTENKITGNITIKEIVDWKLSQGNADKDTLDTVYKLILNDNSLKEVVDQLIESLKNQNKPTGPIGGGGGGSVIPPHEHKFGDWYVYDDDFEQRECFEGDKIEQRPHDYVLLSKKVVTNSNGTHSIFNTYTCTRDNHIKLESKVVDCDYTISIDGDTTTYSCPDCGHTYSVTAEHKHISDNIIHYGEINGVFSEYNMCIKDGTPMNVKPHIHDVSYKTTFTDDDHTKYCICGYSETNSHNWDNGVTEGNTITYTCPDCNHTKTETLGHVHESDNITHYEVIDGVLKEFEICLKDDCTEELNRINVKDHTHDYSDITYDDSTHSASCDCGDVKTDFHTWGNPVYNETTGELISDCTFDGCEAQKKEEHTHNISVSVEHPQTEDVCERTISTCDGCDYEKVEEVGHGDNLIKILETEEGHTEYCTKCGYFKEIVYRKTEKPVEPPVNEPSDSIDEPSVPVEPPVNEPSDSIDEPSLPVEPSVNEPSDSVEEQPEVIPDAEIDYDNYVVETFDDYKPKEPVEVPDIDYDNYVVETFDSEPETTEEQPLVRQLVKNESGVSYGN